MASIPIRAPITVDEDSTDFESQSESGFSENSSNVDNGSEFEDYASGEEFETASEKHFAEEETRVKYRPFVVDPDEESLGNSVVDEEERGADDGLGFGSGGPNLQPGMPIAQLSIEEDEFDELFSDEEDDSLRAVARVDSAPRVRDFDGEDDDKDGELLLSGDELEVNDAVVDGAVSVSGLGGFGETLVERKEGILRENSGGLKHVFEDSVSVNVVKPKVFIESLVEKKQNLDDLRLESDKLIGGDGVNPMSMEIDCVEKEEIGETVDVFVDAPESELTQVHNILAELQDLKVGSSNNGCVEEIVAEPEMEEAKSFDLEKDADFESTEEKTARQIGIVHVSVAIADVIDVDSTENVHLLESSNADLNLDPEKTALQGSSLSDADIEHMIFGGSEAELGESASTSIAGDVDFVPDSGSGPEIEMNKEHEGMDLSNPATLNALLKVASGFELDRDRITLTTEDGRVFSIQRPGSSFNTMGESISIHSNSVKEDKELSEKIQHIRVKFLRAIERLGLSPEDPIVDHVLNRLALAARGHLGEESGVDFQADEGYLDFSLNILVIGKTGVGKSATINSIFGKKKVEIDAFERSTTTVKEIVGIVSGVRVRVLDTPGLRLKDEAANRKILASVKRSIKKFPPDVVLYVDRLDEFTGDFSDLPLLDLVTRSLGSLFWRNVIVTFTHANAILPDGPYGSPMSFQTFVARWSHVVQQAICRAAGEIQLVDSSAVHPVAFVENHPSCPKNEKGERMLSIGRCWRPQLLLLCYSLKILLEAKSITGPQDSNLKKWLGSQSRSFPVPHLLSSFLQPRPHLKPQSGDDVDSDLEMLDFSDEDEDEYDQLPPFKPLKRSVVDNLSKEHRKAYLEEYDYRVNLLQKKQLREEVKRLKEIKKKLTDESENSNQEEEEGPATVPVSMPDFLLPLSFDSDNPSYRYRALEPTWQLLIRPVLESHGWDHDVGYDGINIEQNLTIADKFPGAFTVQITKDKKEFNIHLDSSICTRHGENQSTMAGFEIQNLGRQLTYILRTETQFRNFKLNKTSGGLCLTLAGENAALGLKVEDQIALGKQIVLTGSAGGVRSKEETAFGANFEVQVKSRDYPLKQDQSTLGLSVMKGRGDLGVMANLQSQFSVGRNSRVAIGIGMNNKRRWQISIKNSSCELQIAAIGILPIVASIVGSLFSGSAAKDLNLID